MGNADKKATVGNIKALYQHLKAKFMPNYTMKELREALGLGDSTVPESSGGTGGKRLYNAAQIEFMRREKTVTVTQNVSNATVFKDNSMNNAWMLEKNGRFYTIAQTGWSCVQSVSGAKTGSQSITVTGHMLDENLAHTSIEATLPVISGIETYSSNVTVTCDIFKEDVSNDDLTWLILWHSFTRYANTKTFGLVRATMTEDGVLSLENVGSVEYYCKTYLGDVDYDGMRPGLKSSDGCWYNVYCCEQGYDNGYYSLFGMKITDEGVITLKDATEFYESGDYPYRQRYGGGESDTEVMFYPLTYASYGAFALDKSTLEVSIVETDKCYKDKFFYYSDKRSYEEINGTKVTRVTYSELGDSTTVEDLSPDMFSPIGDTVSMSGRFPILLVDLDEDAKLFVNHSGVLVFDSDGVTAVVGSFSLTANSWWSISNYLETHLTTHYYVPIYGFTETSEGVYEAYILSYDPNNFNCLYTYTVTIS